MTTIKPPTRKTALAAAMFAAAISSTGALAANGDVEGRIADLERQISELKAMMASNTSNSTSVNALWSRPAGISSSGPN